MKTTATFHNLSFAEAKTYLFATLFVAGNIILPQLAHLIPNGGPMLLPIYFFTLIAAYKYGIRTGMLTAVLSPVINSLLFGMPVAAMLPVILIKSSLLAIAASYARHFEERFARRSNSLKTFTCLVFVVLSYQIVGTLIEWGMVKDFFIAVQDFRIGLPGMALQVIGGWLILSTVNPRP
ncbi:MAG: ECF transporter S component [Paludibacter sp.]|nr:ECF transporter S component [Paludibacter sp.]